MKHFFYRITDPSAVKGYTSRRQRIVKHYDTLKSESMSSINNIMYLRIFTKSSLTALRNVLGRGFGIGTAKERPTKARPIQYCSIGSYILSIECTDVLPAYICNSPLMDCQVDGIEFFYSLQNNSLCCNLRFFKISVVNAEVAIARIPNAEVVDEPDVITAYVGALIMYNNETYEVRGINDNICHCVSLHNSQDEILLHLNIVNTLVANFGP